jgi:hypothetical protein
VERTERATTAAIERPSNVAEFGVAGPDVAQIE